MSLATSRWIMLSLLVTSYYELGVAIVEEKFVQGLRESRPQELNITRGMFSMYMRERNKREERKR
jgi:hypothetical protein